MKYKREITTHTIGLHVCLSSPSQTAFQLQHYSTPHQTESQGHPKTSVLQGLKIGCAVDDRPAYFHLNYVLFSVYGFLPKVMR